MQPVYYYHEHDEFYTSERCKITELLNKSIDEDCSIAKASVAPGVSTQLHALQGTTERYIILQGQGHVTINGQKPLPVAYLDTVLIPPDTSQKITNTGTVELEFLCICTPRFKPENYHNLETVV